MDVRPVAPQQPVIKEEKKEVLDPTTQFLMSLAEVMLDYENRGIKEFWITIEDVENVDMDKVIEAVLKDDAIEDCTISNNKLLISMY